MLNLKDKNFSAALVIPVRSQETGNVDSRLVMDLMMPTTLPGEKGLCHHSKDVDPLRFP